MKTASDASKKAQAKYELNTVASIKIRFPKDLMLLIKEHAKNNNESINHYINRLVLDDLEKHKQ